MSRNVSFRNRCQTLQIWNCARIAVTTWLTGKTNQSYHQWFGKASGQNAWTTDTFHIHADVEGRRPSCMYGRSSSNLRHCCCRFSFHASMIAIYDVYFPIWIDFNSIMLLLCRRPSPYLPIRFLPRSEPNAVAAGMIFVVIPLQKPRCFEDDVRTTTAIISVFNFSLGLSWKLGNLGYWKVF